MKKNTFSLVIFLAITLFCSSIALPQDKDISLISYHGAEKSSKQAEISFIDHFSSVKRYKEIKLFSALTDSNNSGILNKEIKLNLFDDAFYNAVIDKSYTNINGSFTIRAKIQDHVWGYLILSTTNNRTSGIISIPQENIQYKIISCPNTEKHFLLEIDNSKLDYIEENIHPLPPPPSDSEKNKQKKIRQKINKKNLGPEDHATIDVMIVYTSAAAEQANSSQGGIENVVSIAVEQANLSYDNSETIMSMRLVHSQQTGYNESGSSSDDLTNLTLGEGLLSYVHDWREQYGADLVAMFTNVNDTGGIGWLLMQTSGRPDYGFSITRIQQATSLTHAHETGHNMGCHHHADQNFQPGPGLFTYSAGWRWTGSDNGKYCDLMTYQSGSYFADGIDHTGVPYFSNPDVEHFDTPTGQSDYGDNARTLREIKHVISEYYDAIYNSIEGTVVDEYDNPLDNVLIQVSGTSYSTKTDSNGEFIFSSIEEGDYTITAFLDGYSIESQEITIAENETTFVSFVLTELGLTNISGYVFGADDQSSGLHDAYVTLSGNGYFETKTDNTGMFVFEDIYEGAYYTIHVFYPGYSYYEEQIFTAPDNNIDDIVLNEAAYPVSNLSVSAEDNGTLIKWDEPTGFMCFRYDDGIPVSNAGYVWGTKNSVLGSAFQNRGYIGGVSWFLNGNNSQEEVKIYIFGLDNEGIPDTNDILYEADNVPNIHSEWNVHYIDEPIYAGRGFMIGIAAEGNLGLAQDDGINEPYQFAEKTQFHNSDILEFEFQDISSWKPYNFLYRAFSFDLGELNDKLNKNFIINNNDIASFDKSMTFPSEVIGYNIYLNNMDTPVDEVGENETQYLFTNIESGVNTIGVQAIYDIGLSEIISITFPPYTDINENTSREIKVYPNPTKDILKIESGKKITNIKLYNLNGLKIFNKNYSLNNLILNFNNYPAGIYIMQITTTDNTEVFKINIIK